ncbi:hypothetical protein [Streptomyces misionensis]|uniref:hypothetical protein n=1 Tax=Streptomyces misionensis TaxID=67331 RepID=UPI0033B9A63F
MSGFEARAVGVSRVPAGASASDPGPDLQEEDPQRLLLAELHNPPGKIAPIQPCDQFSDHATRTNDASNFLPSFHLDKSKRIAGGDLRTDPTPSTESPKIVS